MVVLNVMDGAVIVIGHGIHWERRRWTIGHWRHRWPLVVVVLPEVVLVSPIQ